MYRIDIKNFQSILDQSIDCKGFVALTGKSNLGKSAVRRAVGAVLFNDWDKSFRREGTNLPTEVTFSKLNEEEEPYFQINMKKSDDHNDFTVIDANGEQSFPKVGKSIPDAVSNQGYHLLNIGDESLNLTATKQTDPLFIVSYKQTTNTKILNKLFNITKLETASQLVQRDLRNTKIDVNKVIDSYNEKKNQLTQMEEDLNQAIEQRDKVEALINKVNLISEYIESAGVLDTFNLKKKEIQEKISKTESLINKIKTAMQITEYIEQTELISELRDSKQDTLDTIEFLESKIKKAKSYQDKIAQVEKLENFIGASESVSRLESKKKELSKHDPFAEKFPVYRKMINYIYQDERIQAFKVKSSDKAEEISKLESLMVKASKFSLLADYDAVLSEIDALSNKLSQISISKLEQDIEALKEEKRKLAKVCPTCGQAIEEGAVHVD